MSSCKDGCCGLPGATLDDVAANIRREFAEATSGEGEQQPEQAPPPPKKKISQQTFDDVVDENVEEFEMELEEAMRDAVQQFTRQGVDMTLLITSTHLRQVDRTVGQLVDQVNQAVQGDDLASIKAHIDTLTASLVSEDERIAAGRHGAVGAAMYVCKKFQHDPSVVLAAMRLGAELLKNFDNREVVPAQGLQAVSECLRCYEDSAEIQEAGFSLCLQAITKHEANKRNLKDYDINLRMMRAIRAHLGDKGAVTAICKFLRTYLSDDDRRPGVHPGTFSRAREVGEDYENGALKPLFDILQQPQYSSEEATIALVFSTLKAVSVNDAICKHVANRGGLEIFLDAFEGHISNVKIAANACTLLKAVSRNDEIKRTVGKGKGLGLLLRALDEHTADAQVTQQALQCLSVLCLRQPENCEIIAGLGCLQLVVNGMVSHPDSAAVQRPAIATMRNMVSSWMNKELVEQILDHGVEPLIRKARTQFPFECEEVAYAALRDLGVDYHNA